ncbi:MAG: hypothetical protein OXI87_22410 [Albidovulum sp.]|nr:hypothetical protein [Albidovulum sp.]MDE0531538.1 hypothetical protein [Albidovulum sp.]
MNFDLQRTADASNSVGSGEPIGMFGRSFGSYRHPGSAVGTFFVAVHVSVS